MKEIHFVDTTLRDGPSSLWAMGIRTDMILPVASQMDEAGFLGMEIIASAFFKKCVRELKDDPWARIRRVKEKIPGTPLRLIRNRYMAAFQHTPPAVQQLWLERLAANGISEARTSDPSNTPAVWAEQVRTATAAGLDHHRQPDLLHLAQAYRRVLRGAHPRGREAAGEAHLPQGPGRNCSRRTAPARWPRWCWRERRGRPGGVPHPLQQRPRTAVAPSTPSRRAFPSSTRRCRPCRTDRPQPVAVQHHPQRPRPGLHPGGRRGQPQARVRALHPGGEGGGLPHRRAAPL